MEAELTRVELTPEDRQRMPLCFQVIYTKKTYSADDNDRMKLRSERYGSVTIMGGGSAKPLSKIY